MSHLIEAAKKTIEEVPSIDWKSVAEALDMGVTDPAILMAKQAFEDVRDGKADEAGFDAIRNLNRIASNKMIIPRDFVMKNVAYDKWSPKNTKHFISDNRFPGLFHEFGFPEDLEKKPALTIKKLKKALADYEANFEDVNADGGDSKGVAISTLRARVQKIEKLATFYEALNVANKQERALEREKKAAAKAAKEASKKEREEKKKAQDPKRILIGGDRKTDDMIRGKLEEVTESLYASMKEQYEKQIRQYVDHYFKRREDDSISPYVFFRNMRNRQAYQVVDRLVESEERSPKGPFVRVKDFDKQIDKMATESASHVRESFIGKMVSKLSPILKHKKDIEDVSLEASVNSGIYEGTMRFKFKDGTSFNVVNKVTTVWERRNTDRPYHQYPSTFHDLHTPDGKKRSMVSQEELESIFSKMG